MKSSVTMNVSKHFIMDPAVGVIVGIGIGSFLLFLIKGRKKRKAIQKGVCPICGKKLIEKQTISGLQTKCCPDNHGILNEQGKWMNSSFIKNMLGKHAKQKEDNVPEHLLTYWYLYHTLNADQVDIDTTPLEDDVDDDLKNLDDDSGGDFDDGGDFDFD